MRVPCILWANFPQQGAIGYVAITHAAFASIVLQELQNDHHESKRGVSALSAANSGVGGNGHGQVLARSILHASF